MNYKKALLSSDHLGPVCPGAPHINTGTPVSPSGTPALFGPALSQKLARRANGGRGLGLVLLYQPVPGCGKEQGLGDT